MTKSITEQYLENYLDEKYEAICKELLSRKLETYSGLNYRDNGLHFSTIFEELIFVCLYDEHSFKSLQENIVVLLLSMLKEYPDFEIDLLVLRPLQNLEIDDLAKNIDILDCKELYIAKQVLTLVNEELLRHFSSISEKKYDELKVKLIEGIKNLALSGTILETDYHFQSYWEEFCFISQEDNGIIFDLYVDTIIDYIHSEVKKLPFSELKVLYSSSQELWADDDHNPFSNRGEMEEYITNKLYDMIAWTAANTYVEVDDDIEEDGEQPYYWEDEDDDF